LSVTPLRLAVIVSTTVVALTYGAVRGQARAPGWLSADSAALVHLKVLSYDEALLKRHSDKLAIGVVYSAGSKTSRTHADGIHGAFEKLSGKLKVKGRKVSVVKLAAAADLKAQLKAANLAVVFLADDSGQVSAAATAARELKLPAICGSRGPVSRGLAVAVVDKGGKPHIIVNLKAAKAQGMLLSSRLLSVAEIIK